MTGGIHRVCLLLGSNVRPEDNLKQAFDLLHSHVNIEKMSAVWKTPAVGTTGPDFLNAALLVRTNLTVQELRQSVLRPLEAKLGRVRGADKNAPRPIDLDIIIFDDLVIDLNLWSRAYCAVPVAEILPCLCSNEGVLLKDIANQLAATTPMTLMPDIFTTIEK